MIRRKLLVVGCFAAIAILASSAIFVALAFKTNSNLYADALAVEKNNAGIDNATYSVLDNCMPHLPQGSQACDKAINEIIHNCDNLFKTKPVSCDDERISKYADTRNIHNSGDLQGKPLPPALTQKSGSSGA